VTVKKLTAIAATVVVAIIALATPASASTWDTGTFGPAEEPTWVIPLVALFVLAGIIAAVVSARRPRRDRRL